MPVHLKPIETLNRVCVGHAQKFLPGDTGIDWKPNGQSWSCPYCGSMSVEELVECLDSNQSLTFTLNDQHSRVYIDKYPHAGGCSTRCTCEPKRDGGPIKFNLVHMLDNNRTSDQIDVLSQRIADVCLTTYKQMRATGEIRPE